MAAFAFDCELEERGEEFKIHCTSSQKYWTVKRRTPQQFSELQEQLTTAEALTGKVELPTFDIGGDILYFETFLNKLVSNAVILRQPELHDFLEVPNEVRGTLEFITERPDGQVLLEGYLIKHYVKVERDGVSRYFKMTEDPRGATLRFYDNEYSQNAVGATRISGTTKVSKDRNSGRQNNFIVEQRGRKWFLQAANENELFQWMSRVEDRIKQAGQKRGGGRGLPTKVDSNDPEAVLLAQMRLENEQLQARVELNENKLHELRLQVENFHSEIGKAEELRNQAAEKTRVKLQEQLSILQDNYDHVRKNLQDEVDRLEREKEAQPALAEGKKGLMSWFGDDSDSDSESKMGYDALEDGYVEDEKASEMNRRAEKEAEVELTEQGKMRQMPRDERAQIKMEHRHWNKHTHQHTHIHRHTHIHVEDEQGAIDRYPNTHHFEHLLTHTSGKMTVKKRGLF